MKRARGARSMDGAGRSGIGTKRRIFAAYRFGRLWSEPNIADRARLIKKISKARRPYMGTPKRPVLFYDLPPEIATPCRGIDGAGIYSVRSALWLDERRRDSCL